MQVRPAAVWQACRRSSSGALVLLYLEGGGSGGGIHSLAHRRAVHAGHATWQLCSTGVPQRMRLLRQGAQWPSPLHALTCTSRVQCLDAVANSIAEGSETG